MLCVRLDNPELFGTVRGQGTRQERGHHTGKPQVIPGHQLLLLGEGKSPRAARLSFLTDILSLKQFRTGSMQGTILQRSTRQACCLCASVVEWTHQSCRVLLCKQFPSSCCMEASIIFKQLPHSEATCKGAPCRDDPPHCPSLGQEVGRRHNLPFPCSA